MNYILFKIQQEIAMYYTIFHTFPNAVLINEDDLNVLKNISLPFVADNKKSKEIYGLKVIPIKYGETRVVEVLR